MVNITDMKYIVYYRVSTKRQGESGLGLEAQRSYINLFLKQEDIVGEFTDIKSGKHIHNRPELKKALDVCKLNGYGLAIAKVDRLSRNVEQALSVYNQLEGHLFSCDVPQQKGAKMDKFQLTLLLAFAERERYLISERTKQALSKSKKLKGYHNPVIREAIDNSAAIANSEIGDWQRQTAADRINTLQVQDTIIKHRKKGHTWAKIATMLSVRNSQGELIHRYPKYGSTKAGKLVSGDWHPIQVKRIYDKFI